MASSPFTKCPILFEDADVIVVNKSEGILSHPNPGGKNGTAAFEGPYDTGDRRFQTPQGPVWLIHRLDQDTSGVLLAVKNKKRANKKMEKNYSNNVMSFELIEAHDPAISEIDRILSSL